MQAGKLRHVVTLERPDPARDSHGDAPPVWVGPVVVRASVEPISGLERFTDSRVRGEATHLVRIRHFDGVAPTWRVKWGGRLLNIVSLRDIEERGREMELLCREEV